MRQLITISVGTYHRPFNRLIDWIDDWVDQQLDDVEVVIQYGHSKKPRNGNAHEMIPYDDLSRFFANSDLVVTHGGPSTIMDVRESGKIPIVVPRRPELDEHVDGHQLKFAEHLKKNKIAWVADSQEGFYELLAMGLSSPEKFMSGDVEISVPCIESFGSILDSILHVETPVSSLVQAKTSIESVDK